MCDYLRCLCVSLRRNGLFLGIDFEGNLSEVGLLTARVASLVLFSFTGERARVAEKLTLKYIARRNKLQIRK